LDVFGERSFFTMDRQGSPARVLEWQCSDRGAKVKKKEFSEGDDHEEPSCPAE